MEYEKSLVISVTGGMGCGQSTVCNYLRLRGAKIINADDLAKLEIEKNEEVKKDLKKAFGNKIFYRNGKLNRKLLARIAFSDQAKTNRLNRIVHPRMVSRILDLIEEARDSKKYPIIAIDAALIYELNLENMFDAVVVVKSNLRNQIDRIKKRDKLSESEIIDRINKQIPVEEKAKWADFVIVNNSDLLKLEQNTQRLFKKLISLLKKKRVTGLRGRI